MKVAATFLLGVTVFTAFFLESSTTLVDQVLGGVESVVNGVVEAVAGEPSEPLNKTECALRREKVKAVQAFVTEAFVIANASLLNSINVVKQVSSEVPLKEKIRITPVLTGLISYVPLSNVAETVIDDALAKDSRIRLQNAVTLLSLSIAIVKADKPIFVEILKTSPNKRVYSLNEVVEKDIDIILAYATNSLNAQKSLLAGAGSGCNAAA